MDVVAAATHILGVDCVVVLLLVLELVLVMLYLSRALCMLCGAEMSLVMV